MVLLAIADGNYNFIYANCGAKGRSSDSGIFQETSLYNALLENSLKLPRLERITQGGPKMPFIIVGDSAFALTENIMKPYPGIHERGNKKCIFNYRLSRARRIIENVFGILCVVFRVFTKPIPLKPANCELVGLAFQFGRVKWKKDLLRFDKSISFYHCGNGDDGGDELKFNDDEDANIVARSSASVYTVMIAIWKFIDRKYSATKSMMSRRN
ncbi:unnamed protein product [Euphydryas editha]|uniref:DDE Tnp4 domain-containing protein n=1 Tax=Euphydryas editha TaxID=104508 RepID=A0AAU9TNB8_EUPED|nr:unnamed protein product [Euphydryas editha]